MKKIINGKKYDTDTAKLLAYYQSGYGRDLSYCREELYRKKTGEYFLYGEGGPMSKYYKHVDSNTTTGSKAIIPLVEKEAKAWAEIWLDADEYEEIFGEVDE